MKKLLLTSALLCATSILTNAAFAKSESVAFIPFNISVYAPQLDENGEMVGIAPTKEDVISQQDMPRSVCWVALDEKFGNKVKITEKFTSPKNGIFTSSDSAIEVKSNKNGTKHTIKQDVIPTDVEGNPGLKSVTNCWSFEETDPLGEYSLTVTIDGKTYPAKKFTLTK